MNNISQFTEGQSLQKASIKCWLFPFWCVTIKRLPNGDYMKTNQSIRDVYQILRDRFVGKTKNAAFFDVILNEDNSTSLTATIHGHSQTFQQTFIQHKELIDEILSMFDVIETNHLELGYKTKYGKPSEQLMEDLDNFFTTENYVSYFKTPIVKIQLTIFVSE